MLVNIKQCKELNYFEHYNILTNIDNKLINKFLQIVNNKTCKLININTKDYYIVHKCTKIDNTSNIQCSKFDSKDEAISDFIRKDYQHILNELDLHNLKIKEVI